MAKHRRPPQLPYRRGFCSWCGEDIEPRLKKNGDPYKYQPAWHPKCSSEYFGGFSPTTYRSQLAKRDGDHCRVCEQNPHAWMPQKPPNFEYHYKGGKACGITWKSLLEVDHVVPLWKVAELPHHKRRWYFTVANLQLLCPDHHKEKSAKEASERAHIKRLAKGAKERKGRPIQSRGFQGWRKFNGERVTRS